MQVQKKSISSLTTQGPFPKVPRKLNIIRRDQATTKDSHKCMEFNTSSEIPEDWQAILECRQCKKALVSYIASDMLKLYPAYLQETQASVLEERYSESQPKAMKQNTRHSPQMLMKLTSATLPKVMWYKEIQTQTFITLD